MNTLIRQTTTKALWNRVVSESEYSNLTQLLEHRKLDEQERTLARRVMYGVRHGLVEIV